MPVLLNANRFLLVVSKMILLLVVLSAILASTVAFSVHYGARSKGLALSLSMNQGDENAELKKCLTREYTSFFSPMEKQFYSPDVEFLDPLNTIKGIDNYQNNVDMLGGRTRLGKLLFKDASIALHSVDSLQDGRIQTRWTLQVGVKFLPWQPRPKFTGVSIYTLDSDGIVIKQEDYWDSINLRNGQYSSASFGDAIGDFLSQCKNDDGAEMSAPELPYELLRRGSRYEVRRYPDTLCAQTTYDKRPEGYDRLGSYAGGSNENANRIEYFAPTLMTISGVGSEGDTNSRRVKKMTWPMRYAMPGEKLPDVSEALPEPTIYKVDRIQSPGRVVAVSRFDVPATEPVVRGYTKQLLSLLKVDGLTPCDAAVLGGECTIAQFDSLFSLNKRRNEVWVELSEHPWM